MVPLVLAHDEHFRAMVEGPSINGVAEKRSHSLDDIAAATIRGLSKVHVTHVTIKKRRVRPRSNHKSLRVATFDHPRVPIDRTLDEQVVPPCDVKAGSARR